MRMNNGWVKSLHCYFSLVYLPASFTYKKSKKTKSSNCSAVRDYVVRCIWKTALSSVNLKGKQTKEASWALETGLQMRYRFEK